MQYKSITCCHPDDSMAVEVTDPNSVGIRVADSDDDAEIRLRLPGVESLLRELSRWVEYRSQT